MDNIVNQPAFYIGGLLGVVLGWITLWCFLNRSIGKIVARIIAVFLMGYGINWIVTPVADLLHGTGMVSYYSPLGGGGFGVALGWGVGGLTTGILAMVLTFLRLRPATPVPTGEITEVRTAMDAKSANSR